MKTITKTLAVAFLTLGMLSSCGDDEVLYKGDTSLVPWSDGAGGLFVKQNSKKESGFEYVSLQPWSALQDYIAKLSSKTFFDNLYMDATTSELYDIQSYELKLYDVTEDYTNYCIATNAAKENIKIVKNDKGEDVWDAATSGNKLISAAYEKNTKELKEGFQNTPNQTLKSLSKVFDLDPVYQDRLKNTPDNVVLRTNLVGSTAKLPKLVRIDICIGKIVPKKGVVSDIEKSFSWESKLKETFKQICVSESLINVINDEDIKEKIEGQVLYSYYIADNTHFFLTEE